MHTSALLLFILFAECFSSQFSQAQMASIDRTKAPISYTPNTFNFPEYLETTLVNGIKVYLVEDRTQPLLSVHVLFRKGAAMESLPGLANFTTQLLTKGTTSRSAQQIADEIDFLGGSLNAYSGWDSTAVSLSLMATYGRVGIQLLADVILHPTFPQEEVERLRQQTLSFIQQNQADPGYLASVALTQGLFGGHPYGHQLTGTMHSVTGFARADCEAFYREVFSPSDACIIVAGNIGLEDLRELLNEAFASWQTPSAPADLIPVVTFPVAKKIILTEKADAVQTTILMAFPTASYTDPDYVPMQFLNTLFGAFFNSRLNQNLREEKGYTYGIRSSMDTRKVASALIIGTSVGKDVTLKSVQEIIAEIQRMAAEPITEAELKLIKNYMLGSFALRTETPSQVIGLLATIELYGLPKDYYEQYFSAIAALTRDQLFEVQKRRFSPDFLVVAASGDVQYLKKELNSLGTVIMVDASGTPIGK